MAIETSAHIDSQGINISNKTIKIWKDLNLNFTKHPLTGDISRVFDVEAIKRSVKNLIMTNRGSRPFQPWLGSDISSMLFEPMDMITTSRVESEIEQLLTNFEPRVSLISIDVSQDYDHNRTHIRIAFELTGHLSGEIYTLDTFLDRIK
jgi:phage baseplate assembly protein W